jgi:hypothetical protein
LEGQGAAFAALAAAYQALGNDVKVRAYAVIVREYVLVSLVEWCCRPVVSSVSSWLAVERTS